ncbi:uncharacterized protein METZ01_LOCUS141031, partial [marine metagenome]
MLLAFASLVVFAAPAQAADGDLDTSFDSDGIRIQNRTAGTDVAYDLFVQGDGDFVVGGKDHNNLSKSDAQRMANLEFNADGSGSGLFANPNDRLFWSPKTDAIWEALLMSNGRYAFVGHAGTSTTGSGDDYDCVAVVREADGSLDTSFDGNGKLFVEFNASKSDKCFAGALQSDNKILAGGFVNNSDWDIALARINTDGTMDTSFGTGGRVTADLGGGDVIRAIEVQPDGKIVVAGTSANDFFVARYTSTGALDTSFSSDGIHSVDLGASNTDQLWGMKLQSDGKIVVAGFDEGSGNWGVARLTAAGAMDTSFGGGDGIVTTDFGGSDDEAYDLVIASNSKILVGGYTNASGNNDMAVARYTSAGVLDTSFSSDGKATADFGSSRNDRAYTIGLAANG